MSAPRTKTAFMSKMGRKPDVIRQFGSMKGFQKAAKPWISGVVPVSIDALAKIVENEPCTPEQATAVEDAIYELMERPRAILQKCSDAYMESGKMDFTLSIADISALRASLRVDEDV